MNDPNFCSGCLICAKLCVHPKARLKLNDCNLTTTTKRTRPTSRTSNGAPKNQKKTSVEKQELGFQKNVSKFWELFNSPTDKHFQKDFNKFFKFSTLSSKCSVCDNCQNRIKLISKVMIQIETLESQLIKLKKSVEKDLSVQITAENGSKQMLNNKIKYFFIDNGAKTRLFREKLKEKLQISSPGSKAVDISDVIESTVIPKLNGFDPNTDADLLEGLDVVPAENRDDLSLLCDDEYFDIKPNPDHGDDIDDSFDDRVSSCCDDVQPNPTQNEENKLDVDPENEIRDRTNSHVYVSLEVQGTTCTLTLSNLEEPVVIDDALKFEDSDSYEVHSSGEDQLVYPPETETSFSVHDFNPHVTSAKKLMRPRAPTKSLKMCKKHSSSGSNNRKMLKCTFVDPVKGKCRVKVLDQDRLNAHVNRSHKNIPENEAYACNLCPFATGSIKQLNLHREQHAGHSDTTSETANAIQDIDCYDQIQENDKITSEIEFGVRTKIQDSDSKNLNAGVTNPETEDVARTIDDQYIDDHQNDKITTEIEFYFEKENQCSGSPDINFIQGITNIEAEDVAHTLTLNQLEGPNNSDVNLLEFRSAEEAPGFETNRKWTSQAKPDPDLSERVTKSDLSIRKRRRPTKVKLKRDKPVRKRSRDASELLPCTHVDPVKGKCGFKLLDQDRLDAHINRYHKKIPEGKSFTCNLCPFATRTMKYLTFHKKIHAGIKDATCEICGMSFRTENYLLHHKRRKHGEPFPFHCNICEKGFNDAYFLKLHNYRNHAEGVDFTLRCSVCNEGFHSKMHLNQHMVKHAERTFKCDECPKAFQTNYGLKRHKRTTHTGIRPFACDLCNWKFCTQYRLDAHRSIHTEKRPFLCQECGFSCRLPGLLTSHLKVHANNHSLAEQGIEKAPRLAKPRNRRLMIFENTVPLSLPTATQTSVETSTEIITQQAESQVAME